MAERRGEEREEKVGVVEKFEWRDGRWWYYVRYPDGTAEWVPEERLRKVG